MRKKSKIVLPQGHLSPKESLQAFRADKELTQLLSKLPNKTIFIIRALRNEFSHSSTITCSHCEGVGKILIGEQKGNLRLVQG